MLYFYRHIDLYVSKILVILEEDFIYLMKQLVLQHQTQKWVYRGIGVFLFIASVAYALSTKWETFMNFLMPFLYFLIGVGYATSFFGTLINKLTLKDNVLIIRWYSKILKKRVSINDIIEITGDDNFIRIMLTTGKPVILPITMLEPEEIRSVFNFLKEVTAK